MTDEDIEKIAERVVERLSERGVAEDPIARTEYLLRGYQRLMQKDDRESRKMLRKIDVALEMIRDDDYYDALYRHYVLGDKIESIAEDLNCGIATVSRNKNRLIKQLSCFM
jgi:hypothetical protein